MNEIEGMITELVRTYKIIEDAEVLMLRYWKKSEYVLAVCETLSVNS